MLLGGKIHHIDTVVAECFQHFAEFALVHVAIGCQRDHESLCF